MNYYAKRFFGQQGIVTDGLKLWLDASNPLSYPGTGTLWSDLSGNGNNGTMVNGVAYSTANGGVMSFDGVNDYVNINNSSTLSIGDSITVSIWAKRAGYSAISESCILQKESGVGNRGGFYIYMVSTDLIPRVRVRSATNTTTVVSAGAAIQNNIYFNVCFAYSDATLSMYINGILVSSIPSVLLANTTVPLGVGAIPTATDFNFNGQLNDVTIYNRVLTPEEVNQNFNVIKSKYGL